MSQSSATAFCAVPALQSTVWGLAVRLLTRLMRLMNINDGIGITNESKY
jgi:hypothetical protein